MWVDIRLALLLLLLLFYLFIYKKIFTLGSKDPEG